MTMKANRNLKNRQQNRRKKRKEKRKNKRKKKEKLGHAKQIILWHRHCVNCSGKFVYVCVCSCILFTCHCGIAISLIFARHLSRFVWVCLQVGSLFSIVILALLFL